MIQVYADDVLVYDNRLEDYALTGLTITVGENKGGAAEITMPPGHPAYNSFTSYRTLVTVYKDGALLFRGRALYATDDFYNRRRITCEGERCFLRDGIARPYLYQDEPAAIFEAVIGLYNAQVDAFKHFKVGTVTVTDSNNYIRIESETAESFYDVIDKLVQRCGGYIVFTTNDSGQRVINWYEDPEYRSSQAIEFGSNLMDFARSGASTDLATVIIPYGAKDETTGERITVESVNNGLDYIQDDDAVMLRGKIAKSVYWDDVADPSNLLTKAQKYLENSKNVITSLELTALDLSIMDTDIDSFMVGDFVRVRSKPHGVDEDFRLTERTMDLLQPANDRIILGKDVATLTGADVAGDRKSASELQRTEQNIKSDYTLNIAAAVQAAQQTLTTLIQQTSDEIRLEVAEQYATNDNIQSLISTSMTQLSDSFNFQFTELQAIVDANSTDARTQFEAIEKYIRFINGDILLGEEGNQITLRIENDVIRFLEQGVEVAYISNNKLYITDAEVSEHLAMGKGDRGYYDLYVRSNKHLTLKRRR